MRRPPSPPRPGLILACALAGLWACNDDPARVIRRDGDPGPLPLLDARPLDRGVADASLDQGSADADLAPDAAQPDLAGLDQGPVDQAVPDQALPDMADLDQALPDMAEPDLAIPDLAIPDLAIPDLAIPDLAIPDMAIPDLGIPGVPPGRTPCDLWGEGWVLWSFHYDAGSRSPRVDVWDATCDYGFQNQACSIFDICRGAIGCQVPRLNDGAVHLSANTYYLQIRFAVQGLAFQQAALFVEARATRGGGSFEATQPGLGGGFAVDQVAGDYRWYGMDWSDLLSPGDDPGLTAVRIAPANSAIAVRAAALCVR